MPALLSGSVLHNNYKFIEAENDISIFTIQFPPRVAVFQMINQTQKCFWTVTLCLYFRSFHSAKFFVS